MGHGDMQEFNSPSLASIVPCDFALLLHMAEHMFVLLRFNDFQIPGTFPSMPDFLAPFHLVDACMRIHRNHSMVNDSAHSFVCSVSLNLVVQTRTLDIRRMRFQKEIDFNSAIV